MYTALGPDHALEQANKIKKIQCGIKGITNNQVALDQYFIITPEISSIIEKFYTFFSMTNSDDPDHNYQPKRGKNKRNSDNVEKLTAVFDHHNANFEKSDSAFNTLTKKILPEKFAKRFLNYEQEGEKRLQEFTNYRMEGIVSIWKLLKKTKLQAFNADVKSFKTDSDGKTTRFKEEINFNSRLILATRRRSEIDISKHFGDYAFSVVPKSFFHDDGKLVPTKDKYVILQELEHLHPEIDFTTLIEESQKVIIFDGKAVVNRNDIQKQNGVIKTCRDFADVFSKVILKENQRLPEVLVLFER